MRRSTSWLVASVALFAAGAARAGTLYVCEGANGVKSYQDTPCPAKAKTVGIGTYKSTPYAPPPVRSVPTPAETPAYASAPPPPQIARPPTPDPVGWICETTARRWLQFSPCPATYMRAAPVDVDGINTQTGGFIHGTGSVAIPTPVESTPLTHAGVCLALGDHSIRVRHSGSSDVYERSVLKSKHGCG